MKYHRIAVTISLLATTVAYNALAQELRRVTSFGTPRNDYFRAMVQTPDGGSIVLGSMPVIKTGANATDALWLVRLNAGDSTVWGRTFNDFDCATDATALGDTVLAVAGFTYQSATGARVTKADACILGVDTSASLRWSVVLRGADADIATAIARTAGGSIIAGGTTRSFDGDFERDSTAVSTDGWLAQFAADGSQRWIVFLGGSGDDIINSIAVAPDGSIYFVGSTTSTELPGHHGALDLWLGKLAPEGELLWQRCLGGSASDSGTAVIETGDGGIMVSGQTSSSDGDVSVVPLGPTDAWVIAADSAGGTLWQRVLGTIHADLATSISVDETHELLLVSTATDSGATLASSVDGRYDVHAYFLDRSGVVVGRTVIAGGDHDMICRLQSMRGRRGFRASGYTRSSDGYFAVPYGATNGWVASIDRFLAAPPDDRTTSGLTISSRASATVVSGCFDATSSVVVHDVIGREVFRRDATGCQHVEVPHCDLSSGQYIISVVSKGVVVTSALMPIVVRCR